MDRFISLKGMVISGSALPSEAETLAIQHFNNEINRMTGKSLPLASGINLDDRPCIKVGTVKTLDVFMKSIEYVCPHMPGDEDIRNQSYFINTLKGEHPAIIAAGYGTGDTPRSTLGMSYALGDLIRRLDIRNGKWGFNLPDTAIIESPKMPARTLYLMNSYNFNPGLSLEYFNDSQIDEYVDMLVDARYSRISLWQWALIYLYPGNNDSMRPTNEMIHKVMLHMFDRARRRGLEVYHQLTPAHINLDLLPNEKRFESTGYYGRSGVCWSQPEGRDLAKKIARFEMEYYGPVDGYVVWFYDPAGCFCKDCKPNQADRIFDQLMTVVDLAKNISPNAKFEAVLWPTWVFSSTPTINYKPDEVKAFVSSFLEKCVSQFGKRNLTIEDSCESDSTNIYNGLVKADEFKRNAFMYSALGMASEQGYPFAGFRFGYLNAQMGKARDRGLEEANLFIQYAATNKPGVFAFTDTLYESKTDWKQTAERYASTVAKGSAKSAYLDLLSAMEMLSSAASYAEMESAVSKVETSWNMLKDNKLFFGDREWLKGYVAAQRWYLRLAQAKDDAEFTNLFSQFKTDVGSIPMYKDFMEKSMTPALINQHLKWYWRGPVKDDSMVGVFK